MADDNAKLAACPHCGKEDAFVERSDLSACHVVCNECGARGPACCDETEADAAASENDDAEPGELAARRAWNTRAAPPAMDREAVNTIAFVQEWMMSGDHEADQWHRDFAAAIDARTASPDPIKLAERFCAAPLPESVCVDLCATQPGVGRYGTNLMTVAEAAEVLRSILPFNPASAAISKGDAWQVEMDDNGEAMICTGCGTTRTVAAIVAGSATAFTCCPERKMVPARSIWAATPASHASDGGKA